MPQLAPRPRLPEQKYISEAGKQGSNVKRRGVEAKLFIGDHEARPAFIDKKLVEAISEAHVWLKQLSTGAAKSAAEIAVRQHRRWRGEQGPPAGISRPRHCRSDPRRPSAGTAVIDQLRGLLRSPEIIIATWRSGRSEIGGLSEADVRETLEQLDPLWDELFPAEQARIVQLLVERVDVSASGLEIRLRVGGLANLV